jgi:cell division protein ZapA
MRLLSPHFMPKQPVRVHIFNQSYTLVADDDAGAVQEIAHQIDELMVSIANRSSSGDSTRVAVMACLHLADKLREAEKKLRSYEDKSKAIGSLLDQALA